MYGLTVKPRYECTPHRHRRYRFGCEILSIMKSVLKAISGFHCVNTKRDLWLRFPGLWLRLCLRIFVGWFEIFRVIGLIGPLIESREAEPERGVVVWLFLVSEVGI